MRSSVLLAVLLGASCASAAPKAGPGEAADVAVVLGAGAPPNGWANPLLVERVCRGVAEYKSGRARALLMSGGYTSGHIAEAEMMRAVAVLAGVPAEAVWLENSAVNTMENAAFSARVARGKGARRGLLVTHRSHMPWALETFKTAGEGYWAALSTVAADGAGREPCFPPAPEPDLKTIADMLVFDVTEEGGLDDVLARPADVPSPALARAALAGAAAYRAGRAKRLYFAVPEPSTGTWTLSRGSAHGHISRTELARVLATALGVAWDDLYISSARRASPGSGAVEPGEDPWLRIPGAKVAIVAPPERQAWWRTRFASGLNALLPEPELLSP